MQFTLATIAAVAALLPTAFAHYNFDKLIVDGKATEAYEYVRKTSNYNSPVTDVTSKDFTCNVGSDASAATTKTHQVTAGSTVGFTSTGITHPGPLNVYLSLAPGAAAEYDGSGDWFKIYELGVKKFATASTGVEWVTDGASEVTYTLPKAIPNGEYLMRVEHIALHGAGEFGGSQFYIGCAQISVTGGAGGSPAPLVKIPGVYDGHESGILMKLYYPPVTNYTIPGPAVYGAGAGGGSAAPAPIPAPVNSVTSRPGAIPSATSAAAVTSVADATSAVEVTSVPEVTSIADTTSVADVTSVAVTSVAAPTSVDAATSVTAVTSAPIATSIPASSGFATVVRPTSSVPVAVCPAAAAAATPTIADAVGAPGGGKEYAQCGGVDFKGTPGCASGLICKVMNPYYSQCLKA